MKPWTLVVVMPVQLTCHDIDEVLGVKFVQDWLTTDALSAASTSLPLEKNSFANSCVSYTNHQSVIGVLTDMLVASMSPVVDEVASTVSMSKS